VGTRRVVASLPLSGPQARAGRDVLRGAELAMERMRLAGVDLAPLDSFATDRERRAGENARRAAEDTQVVAYLGDFHSSQVQETAPILAEASLLAVAPVATFAALGGDTLVRLMPHDGVGARAIARWLAGADVRELLVVHDHDADYGVAVGAMCADAAREQGLGVRMRPVWDHDERPDRDLDGAGALLYVGVAGSGAAAMWDHLHRADPSLWLLGSEGVAEAWLARELQPQAAERTRFFIAQRAPTAFYGYEAMALILDAIAAGDGDRAAIVHAARSTRDRDSVLGRYSIDDDGHTTTTAYGRLAVAGGELVWDLS
jgi:branched-chain amino acid transport system substrate-binding protein